MLLETDLAGNLQNEYIFFNGQRVARYDLYGYVDFYIGDHLGSVRLDTDVFGDPLDDSDYYPFGGERAALTNSSNHYKFTGMEHDSESGLDHTWFRQYSSTYGRWMTPDPAGMAASDPANPQSWNRYAYVTNSPTNLVDAFGLIGNGPGCYDANNYPIPCPPTTSPALIPGDPPRPRITLAEWDDLHPVLQHRSPMPQAANNATCAGKTVQVSPNVRIQSDSNGTITAVGVQLTGPNPYLGTPGGTFVNVPAYTSIGASLDPNGALTVAVSNPVFVKPGGAGAFTGAFISSATFSSGAFSQVRGAVALEGIPFGSKTTASTFLLNRVNQNSQLVSFASLLQSVARLGQQLIGCSVVTGN